jgi:hypothetical protein
MSISAGWCDGDGDGGDDDDDDVLAEDVEVDVEVVRVRSWMTTRGGEGIRDMLRGGWSGGKSGCRVMAVGMLDGDATGVMGRGRDMGGRRSSNLRSCLKSPKI